MPSLFAKLRRPADRREPSVQQDFPLYTPVQLMPWLHRITAPNGGKLTGPGTNTYLVGTEELAVIDPGVRDARHLDAIVKFGAGRIRWVGATHTHPDHSTGAMQLAERVGAQTFGHGSVLKGSRKDTSFVPTQVLGDGDAIEVGDLRLRALHTPGHTSDHLCFLVEGTGWLIAGDQVMDGSTVVIALPDGHVGHYIASLQRMQSEPIATLAPAHGNPLGKEVLQQIIDHRLAREGKVLAALEAHGPASLGELVRVVYTDVPRYLHPLAKRSLDAHVQKLVEEGRVHDVRGRWALVLN